MPKTQSRAGARPVLSCTVLFALCFASVVVGQDQPGENVADRATSNQSLEIDSNHSNAPEVTHASNTENAQQEDLENSPKGEELEIAGQSEESGPVRTLRPRTTGTAVLGRPDAGDIPWYRSGIGALAIVLVVIIGVFFAMRRFVPSMRAPEGEVLKVVARASLTPKQTLSLVQLGRRFVLVAISAGRVDTLCEVNDADEVAELMMATGAKFPAGSNQFATQLRSEANNYDVPPIDELEDVAGAQEEDSGRAVSDLLSRLKSLQRTG